MKQSDALDLVDAGTLARPGPIGRIVRVLLGAACLFALVQLVQQWSPTAMAPRSTLDERLLMTLVPVCVFNYVVNIGFGRSWAHMPLIVSVSAFLVAALVAYAASGSIDSPILGIPLNLWLGYFYSHLGLSFAVSAVLATPGCEMRSIPELFGRVRGEPAAEHRCPATFMTKIDAWEQGRRTSA